MLTFVDECEILIHLLDFLADELVLQFLVELVLGDIFVLVGKLEVTLPERLSLFLNLSDLIDEFVDVLHHLDLLQD